MSMALSADWKQEPVSPLNDDASWVSEETFYLPALEHDDFKHDIDCETKAEIASKLLDNLDQLEDLDEWIKNEEPFNNWLDGKILPTILDDVDAPHCVPITPVKIEDVKSASIPDTPSLLKEFETVLDAVEMTHGTLTPPQSPPYEQPMLTTLEPISPHYRVPSFDRAPLIVPLDFPLAHAPQPDVAHELAVVDELVRSRARELSVADELAGSRARELADVDELVRSRARDMVEWSAPPSPGSSSSSFGDCSSDDPEWMPEVGEAPHSPKQTVEKQSRKRSKPYARVNSEDKKSRKKEQNKNAATRYRMKKKAEVEEILEEERGLQKQNEDLDNKIGDLQREIKYLKGLMRDLFRAKGLIN